MTEQKEKKYSGYGYHGGGRKATGIKRVAICISGQPEQIKKLKKMAAREGKTVSAFIFEKTGINKMSENNQKPLDEMGGKNGVNAGTGALK